LRRLRRGVRRRVRRRAWDMGPAPAGHNGAGIRRCAAARLGRARLARLRDASARQQIAAGPVEQIDRSWQDADVDPRFKFNQCGLDLAHADSIGGQKLLVVRPSLICGVMDH
jgi:hypothetical protein